MASKWSCSLWRWWSRLATWLRVPSRGIRREESRAGWGITPRLYSFSSSDGGTDKLIARDQVGTRVFSESELSLYNGTDSSLPIYLAIKSFLNFHIIWKLYWWKVLIVAPSLMWQAVHVTTGRYTIFFLLGPETFAEKGNRVALITSLLAKMLLGPTWQDVSGIIWRMMCVDSMRSSSTYPFSFSSE